MAGVLKGRGNFDLVALPTRRAARAYPIPITICTVPFVGLEPERRFNEKLAESAFSLFGG